MYEDCVGIAKLEGGGEVEFIVSPVDSWMVRKYRWWCNRYGYIYRQSSRRDSQTGKWKSTNVFIHREILGLERGDSREGDHWNFVTTDNRRDNLRILEPLENRRRKSAAVDGKTEGLSTPHAYEAIPAPKGPHPRGIQ